MLTGALYTGHTYHLYGEVGVGPGVQAVLNIPFVSASNRLGETTYVHRQWGDAGLGLAVGRRLGAVPLSLQVLGKLPLYDNADLAVYGVSAQRFPAMGDGQVDITATLAAGRGWSWGAVQGWVSGELGYRHRSEWWLGDSRQPARTYRDGLPYLFQVGWSPTHRTRSLGWVAGSLGGLRNVQEDAVTAQYMQAQLGGALRLWRGMAVEVGHSRVFRVRAAAPGQSILVGVSWSRE